MVLWKQRARDSIRVRVYRSTRRLLLIWFKHKEEIANEQIHEIFSVSVTIQKDTRRRKRAVFIISVPTLFLTFVLFRCVVSDTAEYSAVATNQHGTATSKAAVTVKSKFFIVTADTLQTLLMKLLHITVN